MLYRRYKQEQTGDCGVVSGENLGRQHRVVVCRMKSDIKAKIETRITGKEQLEWEKKRLSVSSGQRRKPEEVEVCSGSVDLRQKTCV